MALNLSQNVPVDDTDSHFGYSAGDWTVVGGSTRQWQGGVHSTSHPGATVAFSFQGQAFVVYITLPGGGGNVVADIAIDGGSPKRITQPTGSDNVYMNVLFQSSVMQSATHTVFITNRGSSSGPSLMFDEVTLYSGDVPPSMNNPPSITLSTATTSTTVQAPSSTLIPQQLATVTITSSEEVTKSFSSSGTSSTAASGTTSSSNVTSSTPLSTALIASTSTSFSTNSNGSVSTIFNVFSTSVLQPVETGLTGSLAANHSSVSIGTIIGSVLGGLTFLVLCLIVLLLLRRRKKALGGHSRLTDGQNYGRIRALKPHEPEPFRVSVPPHPLNHLYPTNGGRSFRYNEKMTRMLQSDEQIAGPFSDESSSAASEAFRVAASSTSTTTLLDRPSAPAQLLNASADIHQHSNSETTSSSIYHCLIAASGDEVPPPYQPSITTIRGDFKSRA